MTQTNLLIIIVTFNSEKYILNCIKSILDGYIDNIKIKILIIDNNSSDNTLKEIKKVEHRDREVELIINDSNLGFASAVNIGLRSSQKYDYTLLLNPDTLLRKRSLFYLLKCATKSYGDIVGGSTYNSKNRETGSYFRFPNLMVGLFDFTNLRKILKKDTWHKYFYYLEKKKSNRPFINVDVVTGGYMLIAKETIQKVGFFDERFFMYLEDVDYCLRANKIGLKVIHCNLSKIFHQSGASSKNKDGIRHSSWLLSRKLFFFKHFGLFTNAILQPVFLVDDLIILIRSRK